MEYNKKILISFISSIIVVVTVVFVIFNVFFSYSADKTETVVLSDKIIKSSASASKYTGYETLAEYLKNFTEKFEIISKNPKMLFEETYSAYPELLYYYNGMSYRISGSKVTVKMKYRNQMIETDTVHTVKSEDEFTEVVRAAMYDAKSTLNVVIYDTSSKLPPIGDIVDRIHNDDYISYMGYIGGDTSYISNNFTDAVVYSVNFEYFTDSETLKKYKKSTEELVKEAVAELISEDMPDYEKEKLIHDYIIENCRYSDDNEIDDFLYHTAYAPIALGKGVCQGYAELACLMLDEAGIENHYVEGESKGVGHAWNIVKIGNDYYHLDLTWDDPIMSDGSDVVRYDYFNISDAEANNDHTWERDKYPQCSSYKYNYTVVEALLGGN